MTEVQRNVVKVGIDFRPIPVDIGDGVVWNFSSDPSPEQWAGLVGALTAFMDIIGPDGNSFEAVVFSEALEKLTQAMGGLMLDPEDKKKWVKRGYGLGPQQAVAEALMEAWTGFPTKPPLPSGKGSKRTGSL